MKSSLACSTALSLSESLLLHINVVVPRRLTTYFHLLHLSSGYQHGWLLLFTVEVRVLQVIGNRCLSSLGLTIALLEHPESSPFFNYNIRQQEYLRLRKQDCSISSRSVLSISICWSPPCCILWSKRFCCWSCIWSFNHSGSRVLKTCDRKFR